MSLWDDLLREDRFEEAADAARQDLTHPDEAIARAALKTLRRAAGEAAAWAAAEPLLTKAPGRPAFLSSALGCAVRLGLGRDALAAHDTGALSAEDLMIKEADILELEGKRRAALALREALATRRPDDAGAAIKRIWLHWFAGDPAQARHLFDDLISRRDVREGARKHQVATLRRWLAQQTAATDAPDDFSALAAAMRAHPFDAPLAVRTLNAWRGPAAEGAPAPAIVHRFWDTPPPPAAAQRLISLTDAVEPGWTARLWDTASSRALLGETFGARGEAAFDRCFHPAQMADLARLAALWRDGGLYLDIDSRLIAPLGALRHQAPVFYTEAEGPIQTDFILARPNEPALRRAAVMAIDAVLEDRFPGDVWSLTGPGLVTCAVAGHLADGAGAVTLLDQGQARRMLHSTLPLSYKRGRGWQR